MFKVGDVVLTDKGETGVIIKPWGRETNEYDWIVRIAFSFFGNDYQSTEFYRNHELQKIG